MTHPSSLLNRSFDSFDPWDVALGQCEEGTEAPVSLLEPFIEYSRDEYIGQARSWHEVPCAEITIPLRPIPLSQGLDIASMEQKGVFKLFRSSESPERRLRRLKWQRDYYHKRVLMKEHAHGLLYTEPATQAGE